MRTPKALDALARWLVLTLAGVGLFALIPGARHAAPGFSATRWFLALHPVQVVAVGMILLAWLLLVLHVVLLGGLWVRDLPSVALAASAVAVGIACLITFATGVLPIAFVLLVALIVVQVGLCLRIDALSRRRSRELLPERTTETAATAG